MFRSKYAAAAGAVVLAGGLTAAALAASPSFASTSGGEPGPSPTCSVAPTGHDSHSRGGDKCPTATPTETVTVAPVTPSTTPPPNRHHRVRVAQEDFDIQIGLNSATATAEGPVRFTSAVDNSVSDVLDTLSQGGSSVNVRHEALGGVAIDRQTCSITIDQNDLPWYFEGGTGVDRFAFGTGLYTIRGILSFPTRDFRCTLPRGLTVSQATYDLNSSNGGGLPQPLAVDIGVQATGWATVQHRDIKVYPVSPYQMPVQGVTVDPNS